MNKARNQLALPSLEAADPRRAQDLLGLEPSTRARAACRALGLETVGDFLDTDRERFLALKNCGERTYRDLVWRVRHFLSTAPTATVESSDPDRGIPLTSVVQNPRALRAFRALGLQTVGDFLNTPREALLQVRGFGERTYWSVAQEIRASLHKAHRRVQLLPDSLLDVPLVDLRLTDHVSAALASLDAIRVRDVLAVPNRRVQTTLGERGVREFRRALDRLVRIGVDRGSLQNAPGPGERLAALLREIGRPMQLEDILFHYRDRFRFGNLTQLQDRLRADARFLEVGQGLWGLRAEFQKALREVRPEADAVVDVLLAQDVRQDVFKLHADAGVPQQRTYLVIEDLRQDPRVRYLGRGVFCRADGGSQAVRDIEQAMHKAMGEIVVSRYVANQHPRRQRLAECLIRENRALVETAPDRVDLLTNYPFNEERLTRLFATIEDVLRARGYADVAEVRDALCRTDLGGDWLSEHMLLDLLRRHARFELLPGRIIAQEPGGLAAWILRKARACLRHAECSLTPEEVLAEAPEIAPFAECLEELMERDPMVQRVDALRFSVL